MIKSIGSNKIKTAVFISGTGSNLKNLIKFSKQKTHIKNKHFKPMRKNNDYVFYLLC